jgi:DNA-binding MarR family transcriptional regulator
MDTVEILIDIRKIVRSINLESKRIQKDFGISIPQLLCLGHLKNSNTHQATHGELMRLLSLNSSTITGIINRLESRKYVKRVMSKKDKRVTLISITAKGLKVVNKAPRVLHDQLAKKIDLLPLATKQAIRESLTIIVKSMNIEAIDASPVITISEPIDEAGNNLE